MGRDFKDYRRANAPTWLSGNYGTAWSKAMGDGEDSLVARIKAAVKARFIRLSPPDAVDPSGEERSLRRGPAEGIASFRERIHRAWDTWVYAGTAYGLLTALFAAGYTSVHIAIKNGILYKLDTSGNLVITNLPGGIWLMDLTDFWSEFEVIFMPPLPTGWTPPPGEASNEALLIKQLIRDWKPAHATCKAIRIITAGNGCWGDPLGTWGDGSFWGSDAQVVWSGV